MNAEELIGLYNAILIMQNLKNKKSLIKYEFNKFLYELQKDIEVEAKDLKKQLQLMIDARKDLRVEHADKDPDTGEVIYIDVKDTEGEITGQRVLGLNPGQKPEYDEAIKSLDEKQEELFKSDVEFDPGKFEPVLKRKYLPIGIEEFTGLLQREIQPFIED